MYKRFSKCDIHTASDHDKIEYDPELSIHLPYYEPHICKCGKDCRNVGIKNVKIRNHCRKQPSVWERVQTLA